MRIIQVATEFSPFAKVGGLADVVSSLSLELKKKGYKTTIILPKYSWIQKKDFESWKRKDKALITFENSRACNTEVYVAKYLGLEIVFLDIHHEKGYFSRENIYGYEDDIHRFLFFSKAAMDLLLELKEPIDVLHLHDWHTAAMAFFYPHIYKAHDLMIKKIILTIHNFEYQGVCTKKPLLTMGLEDKELKQMADKEEKINLLKQGIAYSDAITTVSPTYAKEILIPPNAFGLEKELKDRKKHLFGILNGLNTSFWNPANDSVLKSKFSSKDPIKVILSAKKKNKNHLQITSSLDKKSTPLFAFIGRLVPQKGLDLIMSVIPYILESGSQFILCGSSACEHVQREFEKIEKKYKNNRNVHFHFKYNEPLSRMIYAGSDFLLIPSLFEPCGLVQLIGMSYGTIPIARKTGGLADTVFDIHDITIPEEKKNGFVFEEYNLESLKKAIARAIDLFHEGKTSDLLVKNLQQDFSWKNSIQFFENLYKN